MSHTAAVTPASFCSQCGQTFERSDLVQIAGNWVCGNCKAAFLSRVVAGGAVNATALRYGGVGIRFAARMVDGLIFGIPFFVVAIMVMPGLLRTQGSRPLMFNGTFIVAGLVVTLFYEVLMLRHWGATLGKMICGLKVVRPDGSGLSWGVAFGRYCMYNVVISAVPILNSVLLITTAIMAGVDPQKRGLHDRVCDTRVIHTR
jgi:uncharacterized RDD family membrane protein YckC